MRTTPLLLSLFVMGCAAPAAVGYAPGISAEERTRLQREAPRPSDHIGDDFETSLVETDIQVPVADYCRISHSMPLEKVLEPAKGIPRVVGTEPLTPQWGEGGSRRRVLSVDDSTARDAIVRAGGLRRSA